MYDNHVTPNCPLCQTEKETSDHPWQCTEVREWRTLFVHDLGQFLDKIHTCPAIQTELLITMRAGLDLSAQQPEWYRFAPDLLLAGILPIEITAHQGWYAQRAQTTGRKTGEQWASAVVKYIWTRLHRQWKTRCQRVHDRSINVHRKTVAAQTQSLLELRPLVDVAYLDLFPANAEEFLTQPTPTLEAWIRISGPAIKQAVRASHRRRTSGQTSLTHYFNTDAHIGVSQPNCPDPPLEPNSPHPTNSRSPLRAALPHKCHA